MDKRWILVTMAIVCHFKEELNSGNGSMVLEFTKYDKDKGLHF